MEHTIPFHLPDTYEEATDLSEALNDGRWISESEESLRFFKNYYPHSNCFFTNSCSSALEVAIRALGIGAGCEVIIPGFGYVAVANAVVNNGATPVFADVLLPDGNIDIESVAQCISARTRAVLAIHYAGNAFDVKALGELCRSTGIYLIEDAAQCIGSSVNGKPLGSFGHLACLSFDYMKNISCGQGGLLIVNDDSLLEKIQTTVDNGTNRKAYLDGSAAFVNWVGKGNNCQINPLASHFLAARLRSVDTITKVRLSKWNLYFQLLLPLSREGKVILPEPSQKHNGHIFFLITASEQERGLLRAYLRQRGVYSEQHYSSLVTSEYGHQFSNPSLIPHRAEIMCSRLLRLPLWNSIADKDISIVVKHICTFYGHKSDLSH